MQPTPPGAIGEPLRLAALKRYAILDTPPEQGFDDIVHLVCRLCAVPVALVSLVAGDRQWFKARVGFPSCETDLGSSVCAHALAHPDELLVIPNLADDPRTRDNPLVTAEPFIRFYAGAPLVTPEGHVLGSLCAIDRRPRPGGLTETQCDDLRALARQVMTQLELRRALVLRDEARAAENDVHRTREVLRGTQAALAVCGSDLVAMLDAVVAGAMRAVPAADGGTVELIRGDELEYHGVRGTLAPHRGLRVPMWYSSAGYCATHRVALHMRDVGSDPHANRAIAERLGLRSAILAPVLRGDVVLGVLKLQSLQPDNFTDRDLEVLRMFAGAATAGFAEANALANVQARDIYWRGLFDRLHEGFLIGEVVRGAERRIVDWRYVEVNPAWGTLVGIEPAEVIGRTVREVFPEAGEEWVGDFANVVESGEPTSFTRQLDDTRRWYEGRAFPLDGDRFGVIFLEVTARHEAERRRNALLHLGDHLRDLKSIPEMTRAAAGAVGRTLGATRAGFGHIIGDVEFVDIEPDWTAPEIPSIAGRHRFEDFGQIRDHLRRGEPLVVEDVAADPRTRDELPLWEAIQVRALVNMPVRERGRSVAVFIVQDAEARRWTAEDLAFLRNVADRLEVGVARIRAEDLQAVLNNELAHRLKNTLAVVQTMALQTLRGVTEREPVQVLDRRILALSRAHDVLLRKSWSAARMRAVMESVLTVQADLDRFALDGPDMDIAPQAALSLSMLLHELATNALKYGALSAQGGRVEIAWRSEDGGTPTLVLDWIESGGPPVEAPPKRTGFGSKLIRMGLLGTRKADLRFRPVGLRAEFRAPLAEMQVQTH